MSAEPAEEIPFDTEAEAGALGSILLSNGDGQAMLDQLAAEDFHDIRHRKIFEALLSLAWEGTLDSISLIQWLKQHQELDAAGGFEYITRLPDHAPSVLSFPAFLKPLKELAARRSILEEAENMRSRALDMSKPIEAKKNLPAIEDAASFLSQKLPEPAELINGILHQGCKLSLGGGSKAFKTWTFLDLAISISHGCPWLSVHTTRARVAYVNLELPRWSMNRRLQAVAKARCVTIEPEWLHVWNLRGHATSYKEFLPVIARELHRLKLGLLIVDPIYRIYGDADENSARDIAAMLNEFEALAQRTGAATAYSAHFSKGNQAGKEAIDRISGSGVFARDADSILTLTRHEVEDAFTVDCTLRNFKAIPQFVVKWDYPLMRRTDDLDPSKLKQVKGRPSKYKAADLLKHLNCKGITTGKWFSAVSEDCGISKTQFYDLKRVLESDKSIEKDDKGRWKTQCLQGAESPINPF